MCLAVRSTVIVTHAGGRNEPESAALVLLCSGRVRETLSATL